MHPTPRHDSPWTPDIARIEAKWLLGPARLLRLSGTCANSALPCIDCALGRLTGARSQPYLLRSKLPVDPLHVIEPALQ